MAASKKRFLSNLSPQVQAEIIKCIRVFVIIAAGATTFLLINFKWHSVEKSKTFEKSITLEIQGVYQK